MTTVRTFIAVELDEALRASLGQAQDRLRGRLGTGGARCVRWVQPAGIHLTLKFLGDTPQARLPDVEQALARAGASVGPFTIRVGGLGCFPNTRQPRVVWVGLEEVTGRLRQLRDAVEREVAPLGFPTEKRPFQPHLTLGRVERDASPGDVRRLGEVVAAAAEGTLAEMAVTRVSFIKSDLRPSGAMYTTLFDAALQAGPGGQEQDGR